MEQADSQTANLIPMPEQAQQQPQSQPQTTVSFTIYVWKFLSVLSWILLILASLESYIRDSMIFSSYKLNNRFIPLSVNLGLLESFYLLLLLFAFYNIAYLGLYKGDNTIVDPLFEDISKYHCFPLFLITLMTLNMHSIKDAIELKDMEGQIITNLVFTILALACLGFIYFKTVFIHDWFIVFTVKKGIFSFFIVFLWFSFFYHMVLIGAIKKQENMDTDTEDKTKALYGFLKGSGIAGALLIPFGSLSFAFIFKDLIAAVTNLLIYIGMVSSCFGINGKDEKFEEHWDGNADGIIEIIMMVINVVLIGLLITKCKNSLLDNEHSFGLE
jgi:hypothetical protein